MGKRINLVRIGVTQYTAAGNLKSSQGQHSHFISAIYSLDNNAAAAIFAFVVSLYLAVWRRQLWARMQLQETLKRLCVGSLVCISLPEIQLCGASSVGWKIRRWKVITGLGPIHKNWNKGNTSIPRNQISAFIWPSVPEKCSCTLVTMGYVDLSTFIFFFSF